MIRFVLFAPCFIVKGTSRSIIQDVQNDRFKFVPNILADVLHLTKDFSLEEIKANYNHEMDDGIDRYLKLLEEEGYGFLAEDDADKNRFIPIDLTYETPSLIENCHLQIRQFDHKAKAITRKSIELLSFLRCQKLAVFIEEPFAECDLRQLLELIGQSNIDYLELYAKYESWMNEDQLVDILLHHPIIVHFLVYNSPYDLSSIRAKKMVSNLTFYKAELSIMDDRQLYHPVFVNNLRFYIESQENNVFLNKKISVDFDGDIRNSFQSVSRGVNLLDHEIEDLGNLILSTSFRENWHVSKDKIKVCEVCELRYMCLDNRLPAKINEQKWRQENPCSYNPYLCKFEGEEGFLPHNEIFTP